MFGRVRTKVYRGYLLGIYPTEQSAMVQYELDTGTRYFGKFGTTSISVRHFGKSSTTSIPVPDTAVRSVSLPKIPRV